MSVMLGGRGIAFFAIGAAIIVAGLAAWLAFGSQAEPLQLALGREVYDRWCASCHGADLEGQPAWQERLPTGRLPAPPHDATGHTWHHSDRELFAIVKFGMAALVPGYESDMPTFGAILTDEEISAVLAFLKSAWPAREREYQAAQSRARP